MRAASNIRSATCWSSIDSKNPQPPVGCSSSAAFFAVVEGGDTAHHLAAGVADHPADRLAVGEEFVPGRVEDLAQVVIERADPVAVAAVDPFGEVEPLALERRRRNLLQRVFLLAHRFRFSDFKGKNFFLIFVQGSKNSITMAKSLEQYMPDESRTHYRFMKYRIHKILLVCCSYDGYILEEDGHIESQINQEYLDLNMSNPPSFTRVSSTREALEALAEDDSYDFILTMYNVGEPDVFTFAKLAKERHPQIPIALLTSFSKDIYRRLGEQDRSGLDYIFCWHGNTDLIIAIIKLVEDKMNAEEDITVGGVQAILLVEDSIRFYSTYLPELYKLILLQNTEFLKDAFNEQQQVLRKRARPKILLARSYEEAVELYERYKQNLLGVISDVGFVLHREDPAESESPTPASTSAAASRATTR